MINDTGTAQVIILVYNQVVICFISFRKYCGKMENKLFTLIIKMLSPSAQVIIVIMSTACATSNSAFLPSYRIRIVNRSESEFS